MCANHAKRKPYKPVLWGFAVGALLFAGAFFALEAMLPSQSYVGSSMNYGYVYSGAKSSSVEFTRASQPSDSVVLFGSSELSTPATLIPQVPSKVFGGNDYGLNLALVGEAYDQSLWHAIAAGAYAHENGDMPKKVAIIVSPTWFADGGLDDETFGMRFSYSLYREFCANPAISESSKKYLAQRLLEQGIDSDVVQAGMAEDIVARLNDLVYATMDDLRLRNQLREVRGSNTAISPIQTQEDTDEQPDFDQLRDAALVDAESSSNNDWGYDSSFWDKNIAGRQDVLNGTQADETYSDTPEYEDLAFFLQVCRESGLEPLVIISPVSGEFFDLVGITPEVRQQCYDCIIQICEQADVPVADFSEKEYEKFFLHDIVHFGWTGWVDVEKAIYDYVKSE